jgi:hypothetical protein
MKVHVCTTVLAAALLLVACGGGSGDAVPMVQPQAAREVPASAAASVEAFGRFVAATLGDDGAEPLSLEKLADAPTSDSDEPMALDSGG